MTRPNAPDCEANPGGETTVVCPIGKRITVSLEESGREPLVRSVTVAAGASLLTVPMRR